MPATGCPFVPSPGALAVASSCISQHIAADAGAEKRLWRTANAAAGICFRVSLAAELLSLIAAYFVMYMVRPIVTIGLAQPSRQLLLEQIYPRVNSILYPFLVCLLLHLLYFAPIVATISSAKGMLKPVRQPLCTGIPAPSFRSFTPLAGLDHATRANSVDRLSAYYTVPRFPSRSLSLLVISDSRLVRLENVLDSCRERTSKLMDWTLKQKTPHPSQPVAHRVQVVTRQATRQQGAKQPRKNRQASGHRNRLQEVARANMVRIVVVFSFLRRLFT